MKLLKLNIQIIETPAQIVPQAWSLPTRHRGIAYGPLLRIHAPAAFVRPCTSSGCSARTTLTTLPSTVTVHYPLHSLQRRPLEVVAWPRQTHFSVTVRHHRVACGVKEATARIKINKLLEGAGWQCSRGQRA